MTKILVTGGNGLVGSALKRLNIDDIEFVSSTDYDLCDPIQTELMFNKYQPQIVVHLAAVVPGGTINTTEQSTCFIKNAQIDTNILQCCIKWRVPRLIALTTILLEVNANNNAVHHNGYIYSKSNLRNICNLYRNFGEVVEIVPTNIYGYDDMLTSNRLIPSIYQKIHNNIHNCSIPISMKRQFIYNEDLAAIIKIFIELQDPPKKVLVGNDEVLTIKDVLDIFNAKYNTNLTSDNNTNSTSRVLKFTDLSQ